MSQISQLKQQVNQVASDAQNTAAGLSAFSNKFTSAIAQIEGLIGGTAKGTDKQLIATLQSADKEVKAAVQALQSASKSAKDWAQQA